MANPNNIKGKGFDKNPQNINRTGANRKLVSSVNIDLEKDGYKATTKSEITDCYMRLINCDIKKLEDMVKDSSQPALVRIVGKAILGGKGFEIIDKMLDRSIGKPNQSIDHTIDANKKGIADLFPIIRKEDADASGK